MSATATMTPSDAVRNLRQKGESMKNDALKVHATFEPGDVSAQGDINIVCIRKLPETATPRQNRQLADGNTQGSRHVLRDGQVYDCDANELHRAILQEAKAEVPMNLIGPVFTGGAAPAYLEHPEHGHQQFPADAICVVTYQRTLSLQGKEIRVFD